MRYFLLLLFLASPLSAKMRYVEGDPLKPEDKAAININFNNIEKELLGTVKRSKIGEIRFSFESDAAPRTNLKARVVYQAIINTGASPAELCISTGTTATNQWVLSTDMSTACSN